MFIYIMLDGFFLAFHSIWIVFTMTGWIWRRTRRLNLLALALTGGSWFVLGLWYGIGYCPLTDWHWRVLEKIGEFDLPPSYIQYLVQRISTIRITPQQADVATGVGFFLALGASVYVNVTDAIRARNARRAQNPMERR